MVGSPVQLSKGSAWSRFVYGTEHQRVRQERSDGSAVWYAEGMEVETRGNASVVKTYWPAGLGLEIDRYEGGEAKGETKLQWTHSDRLGSIVAITDAQGQLAEKLAYDAWGKRRSLDGSTTLDTLDGEVDNKGFTGHEMLDQLDLVHMNGRIYDPLVARFLSADPLIQDPEHSQSYNRYSYVWNNPTNLTDPTGFAAVEKKPIRCDESCRDALKRRERNEQQCSSSADPMGCSRWVSKVVDAKVNGALYRVYKEGKAQTGSGVKSAATIIAELTGRVRDTVNRLPLYPVHKMQVEGALESAVDLSLAVAEEDYVKLSIAGGTALASRYSGGVFGKFMKFFKGCCCFPAGTPVETENGPVAIEQLQVGQLVYARDEATGETQLKPITQLILTPGKSLYALVTQSATGQLDRMEVTDNHPYWVKGQGWVESAQLKPGMVLQSLDHSELKVLTLNALERVETTYNFSVADFHTYFAGRQRVWVHNKCVCDAGQLYRGGNRLTVRKRSDVTPDVDDGLIHPLGPNGKPQGLSVNLDPKEKFVQQHGGAFPVNSLPEGLKAVQSGKAGHYVIAPATPMSFDNFQGLLNQVELGNFNVIR